MTLPVLAAMHFPTVLLFVIWTALAAMAFWVWTASKSKAALTTLVGGGILAICHFLAGFGIAYDVFWPMAAGAAAVVFGYYQTVKPTVDANIAKLKEKAKAATHSTGGGSGTPPAAS